MPSLWIVVVLPISLSNIYTIRVYLTYYTESLTNQLFQYTGHKNAEDARPTPKYLKLVNACI